MSTASIVLAVLLTLLKGLTAQWEFTTLSNTHDGRPCLTDCIEETCIVDWEENRMSCKKNDLYFAPTYKYRTAQIEEQDTKFCLSNCGYFGYEYEWCVTSNDKKWDYCNSGDKHVSVHNRPCKEQCAKHGETYYWCFVEGDSWQFCAPPREHLKQKSIIPTRK